MTEKEMHTKLDNQILTSIKSNVCECNNIAHLHHPDRKMWSGGLISASPSVPRSLVAHIHNSANKSISLVLTMARPRSSI